MNTDLQDYSHKRYNILTGEWVLVSPHRAKRPWQGQNEALNKEVRPSHDKNCYLCAKNTRINGEVNPDYKGAFVFTNDFAALQKDSKSFSLGTVRTLKGKTNPAVWDDIENWLRESKIIEKNFAAIGTGGNINRVAKIHQKKYLEPVTTDEIETTLDEISKLTYDQRIVDLRLKPDRADVIIPALEIYLRIMKVANINEIIVPKMGLADGMILEQYFDNIDKNNFF
jgi:hypothetical protein